LIKKQIDIFIFEGGNWLHDAWDDKFHI